MLLFFFHSLDGLNTCHQNRLLLFEIFGRFHSFATRFESLIQTTLELAQIVALESIGNRKHNTRHIVNLTDILINLAETVLQISDDIISTPRQSLYGQTSQRGHLTHLRHRVARQQAPNLPSVPDHV